MTAHFELQKVTGKTVKEACSRMKTGKVDISDGFSSEALLYGPDLLFDILAMLFRSFLVHGTV